MQGKEASEQETRKCSAGIDVSKSWLDAHIRPAKESLRVANTAEGIRRLKRWLLRHKVTLVVVEATGKWHRDVYRSLSASQIAVAVVRRCHKPLKLCRNWSRRETALWPSISR